MNQLFAALAHPARRRMLDLLTQVPGMSVKALASHFEVSRIAVMKHLKSLEQCNLVLSKKVGRQRQLFFNHVPIQLLHDRWSAKYSAFWSGQMLDLKTRVESQDSTGENQIA